MKRAVALIAILGVLASCSRNEIPKVVQGNTMGTTYVVQYHGYEDEEAVQKEVKEVLAEIDVNLSNWNERSWVSILNKSSAGAELSVPRDALSVVSLSLELAEKTGGRFDPTISPLIDLWGFGPDGKRTAPPTEQEIEAAARLCGWQQLDLDSTKRLISKRTQELQVNLSACAKGYAVDRVAKSLDAMGVSSYLINIGGELRAGDAGPKGKPWRVAISPPIGASGKEKNEIIELVRSSVATSGTYYRRFSADEKEYSHIIDGATSRPIDHDWIGVTVTAKTCMIADGLATACLILGKEDGEKLIANYPGAKARFFRAGP
ncbi:MAG: FAD:protein FMN transferase [Verrucomicrobiota bacterium]